MLLPAAAWGRLERLFDQQMYCLGRDVMSPAGNLLLARGLTRQSAPSGSPSSSLYIEEGAGTCTGLCSFGLYHRTSSHGTALFLDRGPLKARLTRAGATEVLGMRTPPDDLREATGEQERCVARALLGSALRWLAAYEAWVAREMGPAYRSACVAARSRPPRVPAGEMGPLALQLAILCGDVTHPACRA